MLSCGTIRAEWEHFGGRKGNGRMSEWNGDRNDRTNFTSDRYLKINNCGSQSPLSDYTVTRSAGRLDYHILMVSSGTCEVFYREKPYTLAAGNLVLYAPHETQKYICRIGSTSLWCHFTGTVADEILSTEGITSGVYFLPSRRSVTDSFVEMIRRFHQSESQELVNASLIELIFHLKEALLCPHQKETPGLLLSVLDDIHQNYHKPLTLGELARKSGYSKSRFSHLFAETMGTTPMKYLNDIRLQASCEMLTETTLAIGAVALQCGFNDPLYFSRLFARKYHMTPSEYRAAGGCIAHGAEGAER